MECSSSRGALVCKHTLPHCTLAGSELHALETWTGATTGGMDCTVVDGGTTGGRLLRREVSTTHARGRTALTRVAIVVVLVILVSLLQRRDGGWRPHLDPVTTSGHRPAVQEDGRQGLHGEVEVGHQQGTTPDADADAHHPDRGGGRWRRGHPAGTVGGGDDGSRTAAWRGETEGRRAAGSDGGEFLAPMAARGSWF